MDVLPSRQMPITGSVMVSSVVPRRSNSAPCCSLTTVLRQWMEVVHDCLPEWEQTLTEKPEYYMVYFHPSHRNVRHPRPMLRGWHPGYAPPPDTHALRCRAVCDRLVQRGEQMEAHVQHVRREMTESLHREIVSVHHALFHEQRREMCSMELGIRLGILSAHQTALVEWKKACNDGKETYHDEPARGGDALDVQTEHLHNAVDEIRVSARTSRQELLEDISQRERTISSIRSHVEQQRAEWERIERDIHRTKVDLAIVARTWVLESKQVQSQVATARNRIESLNAEFHSLRQGLYDLYAEASRVREDVRMERTDGATSDDVLLFEQTTTSTTGGEHSYMDDSFLTEDAESLPDSLLGDIYDDAENQRTCTISATSYQNTDGHKWAENLSSPAFATSQLAQERREIILRIRLNHVMECESILRQEILSAQIVCSLRMATCRGIAEIISPFRESTV